MPHFRLETNVQQEKIPKDFPSNLCKILAKSLGKPLNYCVATVIGGVNMSWGGTNEPAAQATLMSIGALGVNENKKHSKALFEAIEQAIGVPPARFAMAFSEIRPSAFYGKKTLPILRNIPSDSEDSELSDDEDEVEIQISQPNPEGLEFQNVDDREDDIPLSELFNLPEHTKSNKFNCA